MSATYDGAIGNQTFTYDSSTGAYVYAGELTASGGDDTAAYVYIEMYGTYGVFADGIKTGTYTIADDETDYSTCGLCVFLLGVASSASSLDDAIFNIATSGTVKITAVGDTFTATLSGMEFTHVDVDGGDSTVDADGCTTTVATASLSASESASTSGGSCEAAQSIDGTLLAGTTQLTYTTGTYRFFQQLDADTGSADLTVWLYLQLFPDYGAFASGSVSPGSYTLSGDDLQYATCGLCTLVLTIDDQGTTDDTDDDVYTYYMATGGSVSLTTASTTALAGSLSGVTLEHVTIATDFTSTPASDDCTTSVAASTFSATVPTD